MTFANTHGVINMLSGADERAYFDSTIIKALEDYLRSSRLYRMELNRIEIMSGSENKHNINSDTGVPTLECHTSTSFADSNPNVKDEDGGEKEGFLKENNDKCSIEETLVETLHSTTKAHGAEQSAFLDAEQKAHQTAVEGSESEIIKDSGKASGEEIGTRVKEAEPHGSQCELATINDYSHSDDRAVTALPLRPCFSSLEPLQNDPSDTTSMLNSRHAHSVADHELASHSQTNTAEPESQTVFAASYQGNRLDSAPQASTWSRYINLPRAPRNRYPSYNNTPVYEGRRDDDVTIRLQFQNRKLQQDLMAERQAHRATELRVRGELEKALQPIISEILQKQVAILKKTVALEKLGSEIDGREKIISTLESLLSLGQQQFQRARDELGWQPTVDVCYELARERGIAEGIARHRIAEKELVLKTESVRLREAAVELREQAYMEMFKTQAGEILEKKVRAAVEQELKNSFAEAEYERGFVDGKAAGLSDAQEDVRRSGQKEGFQDGFAACHDMQTRMEKFRAGLIAHDSPDLDFLTDAGHPDNPFNRGMQIGRRQIDKANLSNGKNRLAMAERDGSLNMNESTTRIANGYGHNEHKSADGSHQASNGRRLVSYASEEGSDAEVSGVRKQVTPIRPQDKRIHKQDASAHEKDKQVNLIDLY